MKRIYRVLILDDENLSSSLIAHTLERFNFIADTAGNGLQGLAKLQANKYDLVICDIMMPEMDGLTFLEKARDLLQHTSVFMLTAKGDKDSVIKAAQNKVLKYIVKPIIPDKLFEKIKETLKIQTADLVDKKLLGFHPRYTVSSLGELVVMLEGCPLRDVKQDIYNEIHRNTESYSGLKSIKFKVQEDFYYYQHGLQTLEEIVIKIKSNLKFSLDAIHLTGDYFKLVKEEIHKYPSLNQCYANSM